MNQSIFQTNEGHLSTKDDKFLDKDVEKLILEESQTFLQRFPLESLDDPKIKDLL